MRIQILTTLLLLSLAAQSQQVGIGTNQPLPGAILDISDTARGVVFPRVGTEARLRLPNTKGMVVFDSVAAQFFLNDGTGWTNLPPKGNNTGDLLYWNGTKWTTIAAGLGGQVLTLSSGTHIPSWQGPTTDTVFIDPRDNQQYPIKQYGTQIWMTKNMNAATDIWNWCYNYVANNCNIYGKLYDIYAASTAPPPGWHLPSDAEWDTLINFLGGPAVAGNAMKSTSFWGAGATNSSGFNEVPAGWYYHYGLGQGIFNSLGTATYFWSSTTNDPIYYQCMWARRLSNGSAGADRVLFGTTDGATVRCIRDH